jgi:hypothetical protein
MRSLFVVLFVQDESSMFSNFLFYAVPQNSRYIPWVENVILYFVLQEVVCRRSFKYSYV